VSYRGKGIREIAKAVAENRKICESSSTTFTAFPKSPCYFGRLHLLRRNRREERKKKKEEREKAKRERIASGLSSFSDLRSRRRPLNTVLEREEKKGKRENEEGPASF